MGHFFATVATPTAPGAGAQNINIILYVASLASNPQKIDPILDGLRKITTRLSPGEPLSPADNAVLANVYFSIEEYLVKKEPLKVFTREQIRTRIADRFALDTPDVETYWTRTVTPALSTDATTPQAKPEAALKAKRINRYAWIGVTMSLLLAAVSFITERKTVEGYPFAPNVDVASAVLSFVLLCSAAWLHIIGLRGFSIRLKRIYALICLSIVLLAFAQAQQVIYAKLGLWSLPFLQQGGVAIGFFIPAVLFYIAMYMFARLLDIHRFATSLRCLALVSLAVTIPLALFAPSEALRQMLPSVALLDIVVIMSAITCFTIRSVISPIYKPALMFLGLAVAGQAVIGTLYTFILIFLPPGNFILAYGGISILFTSIGILLLRSAAAFNIIGEH